MAKREKFGKFVLLEEIDTSGVGTEFRAAKLSNTGLEKVVTLLRLNATVSGNADVAKALMDHTKVAAQLQNPNVVRIHGIGKVDWAYYVSSEFIEGKSLKAIFKRCRQEGFPFSVDHALLIASKICSALEYAHGRKSDSGGRYFHGLVNPAQVLVSYEGEVRTRGFGCWPARIHELGVLTAEESQYLAPEQDSGPGDTRSDTYAVGAMLFEMLTGHPLPSAGRGSDAVALILQARLQNPTTDDDSIPKPLAEILQRSLAADPAGRYAEIQEMRKALDTLLFSGDFTPTTFNLAFFMHSLFREDIDRESKSIKDEKEASYLEYLTEDAKPATTVPKPAGAPTPVSMPAVPPTPTAPAPAAPAAVAPAPPRPAPARDTQEFRPAPEPPAAGPNLPPHEAAAGLSFGKEGEKKGASKTPLFLGLAAVVAIGIGTTLFLLRGKAPEPTPPPTPPATTLSPEIQAQLARLKEYEDKLKAIEEEAKKKEEAAKEETRKKLEAQAKAKGEQVDPAALQKAQEEAAKKARAEQEKKAEEERKKLEEQKRLEEQRLAEQKRLEDERRAAEEKKRQEEAAAAAAAQPQPPATQAPAALRPGTLVNLSDPGVVPPELASQSQLQYPPIALRQRVEGVVELSLLVDEKGNVAEAQVVRGAGGHAGLNEAALESVKRRKYRPANKEGVPVKVWISVSVKFQLPK